MTASDLALASLVALRPERLTDERVARLALYHAEAERLRAWLEAVA